MEKELKRGPWHPKTKKQKPVHAGFYECRYEKGDNAGCRYWTGKLWLYASEDQANPCLVQDYQWRGLAEKPA